VRREVPGFVQGSLAHGMRRVPTGFPSIRLVTATSALAKLISRVTLVVNMGKGSGDPTKLIELRVTKKAIGTGRPCVKRKRSCRDDGAHSRRSIAFMIVVGAVVVIAWEVWSFGHENL
jgi:hypothetical protein